MTDLEMWSALVALGVPWITAIVNRTDWTPGWKWATFAVVSVVSAVGTAYFNGELVFGGPRDGVIHSLLIIVVLATGLYKGWAPAIKQVERATG